MKEITPFQAYLRDHSELRPDNALKVFRLYDNHAMSEADARVAMITEVKAFMKSADGDRPLDVFAEIITINASDYVAPEPVAVEAPIEHVLDINETVAEAEVVEKNIGESEG